MNQHSPLGGSGAERWMNCAGSNVLIQALSLPNSDEEDYTIEGTAAHEAGAKCLREGLEPWEIVGQKFYHDTVCTVEMADAVQTYLDTVLPIINEARGYIGGIVKIEEHFARPDLHEHYYGTADLAVYLPMPEILDITDYKNGAGIVVDVHQNPQLKYYAYGLLDKFPGVRTVRMRIVQPNAWCEDGVVRVFEMPADELAEWGQKVLITAMQAAMIEEYFDAGHWCRFCPAKVVCPLLTGIFRAAANVDPKSYQLMTDEELGRDYNLIQAVKFRITAIEKEAFKRLNSGAVVPGTKLVNKKASRVWNEGAESTIKEQIGAEAYTKPELKSPAQIEALGSAGAKLAAEFAFMPRTGYTVARADDPRQPVKPETTKEVFSAALAKIAAE